MDTITQPSSSKSAFQYGILFGAIMVLEFVIGYVLKIDPQTNKGYGIAINLLNFFALPILFITLGINDFKKTNSGFISLGQSLKIGVLICVVAALIYGIFYSIFYYTFPEYFEEILRTTRRVILEKNSQMPAEQMEMALDMTKKFMAPLLAVPFTILMYAFIGLLYSLICGLIMRKEPNHSV